MNSGVDATLVVQAASGLSLQPRDERWCHLSLCVLDAVFSINANYESTVAPLVRRYARHAGLDPLLLPAVELSARAYRVGQQPLSDFLSDVGSLSPRAFAALLGNRQRTAPRGGILKAEAVQRYAAVLVEHRVDNLEDVAALLKDRDRTAVIERGLADVPGHGLGVRRSYLWMLAGDDKHVKADRMVLRWLREVTGDAVDVETADRLLATAATQLGVTPWTLDHAIWNAQRASRRPRRSR